MPAGTVARGSRLGAERKCGGAGDSTSQGSEQSAYHGSVDHAAFRRLQKTREKGSVHSGVNGMRSFYRQRIRCLCRCCRGGKGIRGWARNQAGRGFLLRQEQWVVGAVRPVGQLYLKLIEQLWLDRGGAAADLAFVAQP